MSKMPQLVSILRCLGGLLLSTQCATADVTYYVATEARGGLEPCYDIDYYITNRIDFFTSEKSNITMNFLAGTHKTASEGDINVFGLNRLSMVGMSPNVVIKSTATKPPTWSIEAKYFYAKNMTFVGVTLCFQVSILRISSTTFRGNTQVQMQPPSQESSTSLVDARLTRCEFTERSFVETTKCNLTLSDCKFMKISVPTSSSPLTIYQSMLYLSGVSSFIDNHHSAISAISSEVTLSGIVDFINNIGENGGALALYTSTLYIDNTATVSFANNTALKFGGAIFVNTGTKLMSNYLFSRLPCFYQIVQPSSSISFDVSFTNNSARSGGHDIYGASLKECKAPTNRSLNFDTQKYFHFNTDTLSSVSNSPSRVCVCENGKPQCANLSSIYMSRTVYPGETITIPVVIVGGDFGTTKGTIYVRFVDISGTYYSQLVSNITECTNVTLPLYSLTDSDSQTSISMYLSTVPFDNSIDLQLYHPSKYNITKDIDIYEKKKTISFALFTTPVFLDITFLQCPPTLYLQYYYYYSYEVSSVSCFDGVNYYLCDCHPYLYECHSNIENENVNVNVDAGWIGFDNKSNAVLYSAGCPLEYCKNYVPLFFDQRESSYTGYDIDPRNKSNFDDQCATYRTGTLCGGCIEGYSLAIGSSKCKDCLNNNGLALIIVFAVAGILLVFLISILNLTVTQGMINGLVVYASIVWTIRNFVILQDFEIKHYSLILAWINLDFGIEACFAKGLDAYWKTWLQFVFPFYTAGLFLVGLKFSSKLSKLFGDRAVPTLATLLFLSYSKLLRTIIAALGLTTIGEYGYSADSGIMNNITVTVWSLDGNVTYGKGEHIPLILAALACLLLLWLPYTLLLLLMQCLRKTSNSRLSRWITRYKPVFDAYYAPLNDKHHYWFGVLLLAMGVILLLTSLIASLDSFSAIINWYMILIIAIPLLFYMNFKQVYRMRSVLVTESLFLMNLILLTIGILNNIGYIMYYISVSLAYIELLGIIIWSIFWTFYPKCKKYKKSRKSIRISKEEENTSCKSVATSSKSVATSSYVRFRDSILLDSYENDDN